MKDIIFSAGIKEIVVSLDFNKCNVIFDIAAKLFKKMVFKEEETMHRVHVIRLLYTRGSPFPLPYDVTSVKKLVTGGRFLEKNKLCVNKCKNLLEKCNPISKSLLLRVITISEVKSCI